ncbi:flagellar filament capping protein FliD [Peribacillus asahii]|uniref:flagellar filament capping protein FliD n=1 Tax=Peribacillus asahii TaxID=228899 RepID=UPI00381B5F7D
MVTRVSGLASGMDTDSLVKKLMDAERIPLTKFKQKKQTLEWQRDDYRAMNTLLLDFRSALTQMKLSTNYRVRTTASTDDTKVTATATSAAAQSSYSISKVEKLATAATVVNTGKISGDGGKIDTSKSLIEFKSNIKTVEPGSKDQFASAITWETGSVESQTVTLKKGEGIAQLNLKEYGDQTPKQKQVIDLGKMNVKVNGQNFEITTIAPTDTNKLKDNQVYVKSDGSLEFAQSVSKNGDINVKVDFIADKAVDSFTVGKDTTTTQLSKGALNTVAKLIITEKDGTKNNYDVFGTKIGSESNPIGEIDLATGKITWAENQTFTDETKIEAEYTQNYFTFNLQTSTSKGDVSENFLIQGSDSLNNVISKVNSSNVGVSMMYDSFSDKVTLTRTETGDFNTKNPVYEADGQTIIKNDPDIIIGGSFLTDILKFNQNDVKDGQNAKFIINGLPTERNSNTFTMNGVSFTLKQTFDATNSPVTVSVNNDSNQVFENIKKFVTQYNELIDKIQEKTSEERYRTYTPLTDEQREQLSDKQQEQWEEKAKSGLLRRDSTLTSLLTKMRTDFYTSVDNSEAGMYNQLAKIGISTTPNYLEGGKLEINETKLKAAIEADPQAVEKLFNASGNGYGQQGIVQRLYDSVNNTMDKIKEKAGNSFSTNAQFTLGKELNLLNTKIDSFEDRLLKIEDRYYRQFTAMETAISKANSQSTSLMQYFS